MPSMSRYRNEWLVSDSYLYWVKISDSIPIRPVHVLPYNYDRYLDIDVHLCRFKQGELTCGWSTTRPEVWEAGW